MGSLCKRPTTMICVAARRPFASALAASRALASEARQQRLAARERKRRGERADSIDELMLADRTAHAEAIEAAWPEAAVLEHIRDLKLGRPAGWHHQGRAEHRRLMLAQTLSAKAEPLGQTGVGMHRDWARLNPGGLPEVAIMGHANCGKSSLLNALAATRTRSGPAAVNSRAGWTAELGFYRMVPHRPRLRRRAAAAAERAAAEAAEAAATTAADGTGHQLETASSSQTAHAIRVNHGQLGLVLVDTPGYGFTPCKW